MDARRRMLLGAVAVLVVSGLLANARTPWGLERSVGQWVRDWPSRLETPLTAVMQVGTLLAVVLVAVGLVVAGRYRAAGAAVLAGGGSWLLASMLKAWVDRPRPTLATLGRAPREAVDLASWPSTHAALAAALATVLLTTVADGRVGRSVVVVAVGLTAVARLYLGVHWGLDVIGGLALGVAAGATAVQVTKA